MEENISNWREFYDILNDACQADKRGTQKDAFSSAFGDSDSEEECCGYGTDFQNKCAEFKINTEATKEQYKACKESERLFSTEKSERDSFWTKKPSLKSHCNGKPHCGYQKSSPVAYTTGCKVTEKNEGTFSMKRDGVDREKSKCNETNEPPPMGKENTVPMQKTDLHDNAKNHKLKSKSSRSSKNSKNSKSSKKSKNKETANDVIQPKQHKNNIRNSDIKTKNDMDITEYLCHIDEKIMIWMNYFGDLLHGFAIKLKDVLLFFFCLLAIIGITAVKFMWYFGVFLLKLILFLVLWSVCKVVTGTASFTAKHNIMASLGYYLSHGNDLFFLITGVNLKNIFISRKKENVTYSEDYAVDLPVLPEEALDHLMKYSEDSPFRILCVSRQATNEEIKANYRKLVLLVHPDKCLLPNADEAFKVLDSAFKTLTDPVYREKLLQEESQRKAWEEFNENYSQYAEMMKDLMNSISCSNCQGTHKRTLVTDRTSIDARYCGQCNCRHAAQDGDVWAENNMFHLNWTCYSCMNGEVYEMTEWAECQNLRQTIPINCHRVHCRLGPQQPQASNSRTRRQKENEHSEGRRSRKKKRHQGRKT